ncbi:MAG: glycosyltransferase [Bacteroidales bacterium]|nr:glycosyltransferase [Bacteroidales bacterium]
MKLSIITINYNNKDGLQKTIDSINSQTWREFEWIIIDGGSTDGSRDLIEKTAANPSSNVKYWCSEPDKGVYNAMNKGISHCEGDYINCMNSGDVFYDSNTLMTVFDDKVYESEILYGDWIQDYGSYQKNVHLYTPVDMYSICYGNICHQAMFVSAGMMKKKAFDESYKFLADWNRWIEAAVEGARFEYLKCTVCIYNMDGISSRYEYGDEVHRARQVVPGVINNALVRLNKYESNIYVRDLVDILERGRVCSLVVKVFIKIINKISRCI